MRSGAIPFQFDISIAVEKLARTPPARKDAVEVSLPFITVLTSPGEGDRRLASEILARLSDRRVLNSHECCDNCIDEAIGSFQQIRAYLGDVQVQLLGCEDQVLSGLIDLMLGPIRQFLTFEQKLSRQHEPPRSTGEFYRAVEVRQIYFDALEQLRAHLARCLIQMAVIADLPVPSAGYFPDYLGDWDLTAYKPVS